MMQIAIDTRVLLENMAHNNIPVVEATYADHIKPILDALAQEGDLADATYNLKYKRWRDYFDFLTSQGIRHKAVFPALEARTRTKNDEDDFLNYTKSNVERYLHDTGLKGVGKKSSHEDRVLSMSGLDGLKVELARIDPVFAVMAEVGYLTMMRIGNLVQIPFKRSPRNPKWMIWPEFVRSAQRDQGLKFNCIGKFNKSLRIGFDPVVIEIIYKDYIQPYYRERKDAFESSYLKRKNASLEENGVVLPKDILWLTTTGAPVKPSMLQDAFRKASKTLGTSVEPHFLRHTGATHMLYRYCKIHGIEPDEKAAAALHEVLKEQLCHESIETTRMYIRTIIKKKAKILLPKLTKDMRDRAEARLDPKLVSSVENTINEFFGYSETEESN